MKYKTRHPFYKAWTNMISRCKYECCDSYKNYGGRGITVCERWEKSFDHFVDDMGPRPRGYTIDRIDVNGNYEPENCRWASVSNQARNRRDARYIVIDGIRRHVQEFSDETGIASKTIFWRYEQGWPKEKIFSKEKHWNNESSQKKAQKAASDKKKSQTHCKRGHPLSGENLYVVNNRRVCRICKRAHDKHLYYGKIEPVEYYL